MANVIKARVVRIGNSRGIRIPKVLLEQLKLGEEVELEVGRKQLVIRSAQRPRQGWEAAFQAMASRGDDRLLDQPTSTRWDQEEWGW